MKKLSKLLLVTSIAATVLGSTAMADQSGGAYVGVKVGYSDVKYDSLGLGSDGLFTPSVFVGYKFDCGSSFCGRMDLSYTYFGEYEDSASVNGYYDLKMNMKVHNVLFNGYLDYAPTNDFFIYGTAGVGVSSVKRDSSYRGRSVSDSDTGTSAQVGFGLGYYLTNNLIADISYKYTLLAVIDSDNNDKYSNSDDDIYANSIFAGLTYKF